MTALLAVAHGSRDPRAAAANRRLLARVAALLPDVPVRLAYLGHRSPTVPHALAALAAAGVTDAVVLPLLLTVGYHSRHDIPALLRGAPLSVRYGDVLGPHPLLVDALADRLAGVGVGAHAPVVLAAAGSSDPAAARDVRRVADLLAARRGTPVLPAYATAIGPSVAAALTAAGPGAAVSTYFLAPGALPERVRATAAGVPVAAPLGDHPALARLVAERWLATRGYPAAA